MQDADQLAKALETIDRLLLEKADWVRERQALLDRAEAAEEGTPCPVCCWQDA